MVHIYGKAFPSRRHCLDMPQYHLLFWLVVTTIIKGFDYQYKGYSLPDYKALPSNATVHLCILAGNYSNNRWFQHLE